MKRIFSLLLVFVMAAVLVMPAGAAKAGVPHVVDNAGLLSAQQDKELEKRAKSLSQKCQFDFVILTVQSTGAASAKEYADDFFDYNDYGFGPEFDGILLLVAMDNREWQLSTHGFGETAFTNYGEELMMDEVLPYMSSGDYASAFDTFLTEAESLLRQAQNGHPVDVPEEGGFPIVSLLVCALIGALAALLPMQVLKKQVRNVEAKADAMDYATGELELTHQADRFLYSTVSKRARPKQTESSSSRGGTTTRTSSSGRTHGGSGGHF